MKHLLTGVLIAALNVAAPAQILGPISYAPATTAAPSSSFTVVGTPTQTNGSVNTNTVSGTVTSGHLVFATGLSVQTQTISSTGVTVSWSQLCPNGNAICTGNAAADTNGCIHDISGGNSGFQCIWYGVAGSSGTLNVTITTATAATSNLEVDDTCCKTTLDVSATSNGNSGFTRNCASPASAAVAGAGEFIYGSGVDSGNFTYTATGAFNALSSGPKLAKQQVMYNLSSGTGAQTFGGTNTLSSSANWICEGGAFK